MRVRFSPAPYNDLISNDRIVLIWLLANCPIKWIVAYIKDQYSEA